MLQQFNNLKPSFIFFDDFIIKILILIDHFNYIIFSYNIKRWFVKSLSDFYGVVLGGLDFVMKRDEGGGGESNIGQNRATDCSVRSVKQKRRTNKNKKEKQEIK